MRSVRIPFMMRATQWGSAGLASLVLVTAGFVARVPNAAATSPPVTTKVSIVVDDVFCPAPFNLPPCKGYGAHLVPDQVPIGLVEFTLLDRRPEATRVGTLSVFLNGGGFSIGDGPSFSHHLAGDGSTLTVPATQVTTGMNVHIANSAYLPTLYLTETGFFDVVPTGSPYLTATHIDIVADSDENGYGTVTPSLVSNGAVEVYVIDHRATPLSWGPLHVFGGSQLPIDITAPAGEICGVTVLCKQTILSSQSLSGYTLLLRAPSIGGPVEFFDIAQLTTFRPLLASADAPKDVSLALGSSLTATERENRLLETSGSPPTTPYTTYLHPPTGNTNVRFDNQSGATHTCSIPGYVNPFILGKTSNITKRLGLNSAGVTVTAECVNGANTKRFAILVQ
jgi:hypothetical protein